MKAYTLVTAIVFGAIVLAHVARVVAEGTRVLKEPVFLIATGIAVGLCVWAIVLIRRSSSGAGVGDPTGRR
jgi:hypothetical protein